MRYQDPTTGEWKTISVKAADTLPIGTIVDYDGDTVPDGWEEVPDYSADEIDTGKKWINGKTIYRKVFQFNPKTDIVESKFYHGITNIEEILPTSQAMFHRIDDQYVPFSMCYPVPDGDQSGITKWSIGWEIDREAITTWIGERMRAAMDTTNYGAVAIIEYTKITRQDTGGAN